jgi:hypothetical protein
MLALGRAFLSNTENMVEYRSADPVKAEIHTGRSLDDSIHKIV